MMFWEKYIGIPFVDGGSVAEGCDCYGLVRLVWYEQTGLVLPDYAKDYLRHTNIDNIQGIINGRFNTEWVQIQKPEPMCMVMFLYHNKQLHCGLMLSDIDMLHVSVGNECRVERVKDRNNLQGYYLPNDNYTS